MRRELIQQEQIILPTGYTRLQYIKSTGTQYINTGVTCGGNKFRIYLSFNKYDNTTNGVLFGCHSPSDNQWIANPWFQSSVNFDLYLAGISLALRGRWKSGVDSFFDTTVDDINKGFEVHYAFGNNVTLDFVSDFGVLTMYPNTLYIMAARKGTTTTNLCNLIVYRGIMWINDVKVRDFIPALRDSDSKPGLYDIVNGVFYTNAGTGEFQYA